MRRYSNNTTFYEYFLVFMFLVLCGFTSGYIIPGRTYIIIALGLLSLYYSPNNYKKSFKALIWLIIGFLLIYLTHIIYYNYYDDHLLIYIMLIISGFFVLKQLGVRFRNVYLSIMYFLAFVSIICYSIQYFGIVLDLPLFYRETRVEYHGIFIWNTRYNEMFFTGHARNCGPFWEPGAFAGYLLMVPLLYFNNLNILWNKHKKKCIVLMIAFVTTFSTQGYIAFFLLGITKIILIIKKKNMLVLSVLLLIFSYIGFYAYDSLSFLRQKIDSQYENISEWNKGRNILQADRFSTTLLDIENIQRSPLIGNSADLQSLYGRYPILINKIKKEGGRGAGSGMTSFIAQYGLLLLFLWIILTYNSFRKYFGKKIVALFLILFILTLGQAEAYITQIFYLSLPFLYFTKEQ